MIKNIFSLVIAITVIAIIYLAIKGNEMQEIKTEIEISAPPSKVWDIIIDIEKWQEWSPIINSSQGKAIVGSKLNITMAGKDKDKNGPQYKPEIIKLNKSKYFHWRAYMLAGFIFTNDKIFKLEETAQGTRLIHIETFKGLLAPKFLVKWKKGFL